MIILVPLFYNLCLLLDGTLCQKDLEKLRTWKLDPNLQKNKTKFLTKQGQIDLTSLGERFKNYFPELLQSNPVDTLDEKYKVSFIISRLNKLQFFQHC